MSTLSVTKPLYTLPTMVEVNALPRNGYNVVSTFSGCGGTCLGWKMDGYRVLWASEFIPAAQETYRANHPDTMLDTRDIRAVQSEDIARAVAGRRIDVLEGSPPCASFSESGAGAKDWGKVKHYSDTKQRTDDLFNEYIRLVRELQPRVFIAENVQGLVRGVAKGIFQNILKQLRESGYEVRAQILDACRLGVPQSRQRIFFVGVRNDMAQAYHVHPTFPEPLAYYYTIADVLPHIVATRLSGGRNKWSDANRPSPTIVQSDGLISSTTAFFSFAGLIRTRDAEQRKYTIDELKLISSFPADFIMTGTYAQQWERIGRAVPPLMARAIAQVIRREILDKLPKENVEGDAWLRM